MTGAVVVTGALVVSCVLVVVGTAVVTGAVVVGFGSSLSPHDAIKVKHPTTRQRMINTRK